MTWFSICIFTYEPIIYSNRLEVIPIMLNILLVRIRRGSLLGRFGATLFEFNHHDCDVVWAATVIRLQDDALGAEMWLIEALTDEAHGLLVTEGIPQTIRRQDHELGLQFVQIKCHDVRFRDDHV